MILFKIAITSVVGAVLVAACWAVPSLLVVVVVTLALVAAEDLLVSAQGGDSMLDRARRAERLFQSPRTGRGAK
jgi:hypothetical protein